MKRFSQPHTVAFVWVADQGVAESYHLHRSEQPDSGGFSGTVETTRRVARTTIHSIFTMGRHEPNNPHNPFDKMPDHLSRRRNSAISQSRARTFLRKSAICRSVREVTHAPTFTSAAQIALALLIDPA